MFLAFYFYLFNRAAGNDAQRAILLSCIMQIWALQAQILMLKLLHLYIIVLMAYPEQLPRPVPLLLVAVKIIWDAIPKGKIWSKSWIHDAWHSKNRTEERNTKRKYEIRVDNEFGPCLQNEILVPLKVLCKLLKIQSFISRLWEIFNWMVTMFDPQIIQHFASPAIFERLATSSITTSEATAREGEKQPINNWIRLLYSRVIY